MGWEIAHRKLITCIKSRGQPVEKKREARDRNTSFFVLGGKNEKKSSLNYLFDWVTTCECDKDLFSRFIVWLELLLWLKSRAISLFQTEKSKSLGYTEELQGKKFRERLGPVYRSTGPKPFPKVYFHILAYKMVPNCTLILVFVHTNTMGSIPTFHSRFR